MNSETDEEFVIGHISDLHFSEGTDKSSNKHAHSIDMLVDLKKRLSEIGNLDFLVVSGDLSNHGDRQSLISASAYIFATIPIGGGQHIGLVAPPANVGVIPGNHDAWNATAAGPLIDRRQKSLENYNFAFPAHKVTEDGCYYDWLQKGEHGILLAFVDTCFLGDTEDSRDSTFGTVRFDQAIAKGKLSVQQTEKLLEWHDRGIRGSLKNPREPNSDINAGIFCRSLKIVVMHHYLFEPPEHKSDYFMRLTHRDLVFRNVALADFDMLLCGHKHFPSFNVHAYGDHFDPRARNRYVLNYFRRLIGLESLPIQFTDESGRRLPKAVTWIAELAATCFARSQPTRDDNKLAEQVIDLLIGGLDDPDNLSRRIREFLIESAEHGAVTVEPKELKAIQKRIAIGFNKQQRVELRKIAQEISFSVQELKARSFLQILCGSSAKRLRGSEKRRSFNVYRIKSSAKHWGLTSERYEWDSNSFSQSPLVEQHSFGRKVPA